MRLQSVLRRMVIPVLWKRTEKKSIRTAQESEQDSWLWSRVKGQENNPAAANSEMEALGEISDAVHAACEGDTKRLDHEAQQAFAPVHNRLMEAIEASKQPAGGALTAGAAPVFRAEDIFKPRATRPWLQWAGSRWAIALCLLLTVAGGSHEIGRLKSGHEANLPVQSLVDDFDANLRSPSPFDFVAYRPEDNQQAAAWLSQSVGSKVQLPAPSRAGVRLLGARKHTFQDRPVAQTHYSKDGVPIALYQVRDPRCGLPNMNEVHVGSHVFLTSNRGNYRVVAWREGEVVMAMVSPLGMEESVNLADALRSNQEPVI